MAEHVRASWMGHDGEWEYSGNRSPRPCAGSRLAWLQQPGRHVRRVQPDKPGTHRVPPDGKAGGWRGSARKPASQPALRFLDGLGEGAAISAPKGGLYE